jgi:hypothetical protein
MKPGRPVARHGASFWILLAGMTLFLTVEPGLFLVVLALGLSGLAVAWIAMLTRMLVMDAMGVQHRTRRIADVNGNEPSAQ